MVFTPALEDLSLDKIFIGEAILLDGLLYLESMESGWFLLPSEHNVVQIVEDSIILADKDYHVGEEVGGYYLEGSFLLGGERGQHVSGLVLLVVADCSV